ncbi:acid protease [Tothia fuscella]|uniref:Probable aspartic-type endopeptidase OPSB n=1 Tax=Tothia fuscella TaxID=1048955 RepID=A0A9P4TWI2_9PEZI|nr:acid protease [Tothia fuscella]
MKYSTSLAVAASLLSASEAINLVKRTNGLPRVLSLDTTRKRSNLYPSQRDNLRLRKRAGTVSQTLDNEDTLYFANVTLGTPGQRLRLDIDTGSSDLWTNSANSDLCQSRDGDCESSGTYNANASKTYTYVNSDFQIQYADNSYAIGDYGKDNLDLGGTTITGVQFGIGYNSTSSQGILGVGYAANEAYVSVSGQTYRNVPQLLVSQGKISTPAYSLWLNDLDANTGSILFGGVDTEKYHGELSTLPIIKEGGTYREFVIGLSSLTAGGQSVFNNAPIPVLLDSGSSLSYLPNNYAQSVFSIFRAKFDDQSGAAVVSCDLLTSSATVDFSFSGVIIKVPMNELVLIDGYLRGRPVCILGISAAGDSTSVLGDTFLRSAYVVYDLNNNEISIAPTNFNSTSNSVKEISNKVPGASAVPNAVSTLAVTSGGARNGGQPSVTAIGSAAAAPTPAGVPVGKILGAAAAGLAFAL